MAYGLRWYSEFAEFDTQKVVRVEIHERDYSGSSTQVKSGGKPLTISWADDYTDDPFEPMRPKVASIEWVSSEDFDIQTLFITDEKQFEVVITLDSQNIFNGYLSFTDCQEPYHTHPYHVTMSAVCGLAFLEKHQVLDSNGRYYTGRVSPIKVIADCLLNIGSNLWIHESVNMVAGVFITVTMHPLEITDVDGEGLAGENCYEYVRGALAAFGAYITQENGVWVIQDIRNQSESDRTVRRYDASGFYVDTLTTSNQKVNIIPPSTTGSGAFLRPTEGVIQRLAPPKSRVVCNVDPGIAVNRLTNGIFKSSNGLTPDDWETYLIPGGKSVVEGDGTPDDPYRLYFDETLTQSAIRQMIELNIEGFGEKNTKAHNIRIEVSGQIKSTNTIGGSLNVHLNAYDRKNWESMDSMGKWIPKSKTLVGFDQWAMLEYSVPPSSGQETYENTAYVGIDVKSDPITNWILRSGEWLGRIYFSIYKPILTSEASQGPIKRFWAEDFRVIINTETPYEATHAYEIDATDVILNGEEYQYTIKLAQKWNIKTLEQRRPENRVMTNYLSVPIVGGGAFFAKRVF